MAVLAPIPDVDPLGRLRASGGTIAATTAIEDLPEPLVLQAGARPPSEVLAELRADER